MSQWIDYYSGPKEKIHEMQQSSQKSKENFQKSSWQSKFKTEIGSFNTFSMCKSSANNKSFGYCANTIFKKPQLFIELTKWKPPNAHFDLLSFQVNSNPDFSFCMIWFHTFRIQFRYETLWCIQQLNINHHLKWYDNSWSAAQKLVILFFFCQNWSDENHFCLDYFRINNFTIHFNTYFVLWWYSFDLFCCWRLIVKISKFNKIIITKVEIRPDNKEIKDKQRPR